ncbi:MAG: hypothetical protein JXR14_06870 [Paracoccaceae bacterium]
MNQADGNFLDRELFDHYVDGGANEPEFRLIRKLHLSLLRGKLWIIIAALVGGAAGYGFTEWQEVKYTSVASVMINTRESVETEFAPVVSGLPTSTTTLESELEVLRSLDLIERLVDRFELTTDPEFAESDEVVEPPEIVFTEEELARIAREQTIGAVADQREIEQVGTVSAVYAISFTTTDPLKSARLANGLANEYLETTTSAKLRSLELSQGWLTERTSEVQEQLSDLGVVRESHILSAPYTLEEIETIKAKSLSLERRLRAAKEKLETQTATLRRIGLLRSADKPLLAVLEVPDPGQELLAAAAAVSAEQSGAAAALDTQLDMSAARLRDQRDEIEETVSAYEAETARLREILTQQARHDAELHRIENDIAVGEAIYQDFVAQLSRRTQQERYLDADARVIAWARPALEPSEPRRKLMAASGMLVAAMLAGLLILIAELRHTRLRTIREFEEATGLPMIGLVPQARRGERPDNLSLNGTERYSPRMMRFARKLRASVTAALRETRDRRGLSDSRTPNRGAKIIAGVATNPDDGLSASILMLAAAFAEVGENVLVVDLDFWNSSYLKDYPLASANADTYLDPKAKKRIVLETEWPGISLLPAVGPTEGDHAPVTEEGLRQILQQLSNRFDRILVDTTPMKDRIDATSLCRSADAIVYFVRWNSTTKSDVQSALKLMADVGISPTAVVATRVNTKRVKAYGEKALSFPG